MVRMILLCVGVWSAGAAAGRLEARASVACGDALIAPPAGDSPNEIIAAARRAALARLHETHGPDIARARARVTGSRTTGRGVQLMIDVHYDETGFLGTSYVVPYEVYVAPDGTATVREDH